MNTEEYIKLMNKYQNDIDDLNKEIKKQKQQSQSEEITMQESQTQQLYGNAYYTGTPQPNPGLRYNYTPQNNYGYGYGYQQPQQNYQFQGASIDMMPQSQMNNPYNLSYNNYYNSEQYMRDFQYGWNLYHDQLGYDTSGGNYVYNGAYVSIPSPTQNNNRVNYIPGQGYYNQNGTQIHSINNNYSYSNNYYNNQYNYNNQYGGYYNYNQEYQRRMEEYQKQENCNRMIFAIYYRTTYGENPEDNMERFEELYNYNYHPDIYYNNQMNKYNKMSYADTFGFVGTDTEIENFNKTVEQILPSQRAIDEIHRISQINPEKFSNHSNAYHILYDNKYIKEYQDGLEQIIPKDKVGKLTFKEMNQIYMPRILSFCTRFDRDYKKKNLTPNQRYSQKDYQKLMEFHRVTRGESVLDPRQILNGEEIHLPDYLKYDKETKDKRAAFLNSVVNNRSNIRRDVLF